MDAITSNEKFVQGTLLGGSRSFSLGGRDRFLAASSVSSSTITIVSRVATGHGLSTGDVCVGTCLDMPGLAHGRECGGKNTGNPADDPVPLARLSGKPVGGLGSEGPARQIS